MHAATKLFLIAAGFLIDNSSGQGCRPWEFRCFSGACVRGSSRCDRRVDCADQSDELNCPSTSRADSCGRGRFQCTNGECIFTRWRCDGEEDCSDASDETTCSVPTGGPEPVVSSFETRIVIAIGVSGILLILVFICAVACVFYTRRKAAASRRRGSFNQHERYTPNALAYTISGNHQQNGLINGREPPPRYSSQPDLTSRSQEVIVPPTNLYESPTLVQHSVEKSIPPPVYTSCENIPLSFNAFNISPDQQDKSGSRFEEPPVYTSNMDLSYLNYENQSRNGTSLGSQTFLQVSTDERPTSSRPGPSGSSSQSLSYNFSSTKQFSDPPTVKNLSRSRILHVSCDRIPELEECKSHTDELSNPQLNERSSEQVPTVPEDVLVHPSQQYALEQSHQNYSTLTKNLTSKSLDNSNVSEEGHHNFRHVNLDSLQMEINKTDSHTHQNSEQKPKKMTNKAVSLKDSSIINKAVVMQSSGMPTLPETSSHEVNSLETAVPDNSSVYKPNNLKVESQHLPSTKNIDILYDKLSSEKLSKKYPTFNNLKIDIDDTLR